MNGEVSSVHKVLKNKTGCSVSALYVVLCLTKNEASLEGCGGGGGCVVTYMSLKLLSLES